MERAIFSLRVFAVTADMGVRVQLACAWSVVHWTIVSIGVVVDAADGSAAGSDAYE